MTAPTLEAIKYAEGSLQLLDQLKLPFTFEYLEIRTCEETWDAIKKMQVRRPSGMQERGFGRTPPVNWRARGLAVLRRLGPRQEAWT